MVFKFNDGQRIMLLTSDDFYLSWFKILKSRQILGINLICLIWGSSFSVAKLTVAVIITHDFMLALVILPWDKMSHVYKL